jgi:hypothetical protein
MVVVVGEGHRLNKYIDTKAECRQLTKFTCKGTLQQGIICLIPSRLGTCTYSHRE